MASHPLGTPTSLGYSILSITSRLRDWQDLSLRTDRCRQTSLTKGKLEKTSLKLTWWTAWSLYLASSSSRLRFRYAYGFLPVTRRTADSVTAVANLFSPMHPNWQR